MEEAIEWGGRDVEGGERLGTGKIEDLKVRRGEGQGEGRRKREDGRKENKLDTHYRDI